MGDTLSVSAIMNTFLFLWCVIWLPQSIKTQIFFGGQTSNNNKAEITIQNTDSRLETRNHQGCCSFASFICTNPCSGKSCSAQCTVYCALGGKCPPVQCSQAAPTSCVSTSSTTQPPTTAGTTTSTTTITTPTTPTTTTTVSPTSPCPTGYSLVGS